MHIFTSKQTILLFKLLNLKRKAEVDKRNKTIRQKYWTNKYKVKSI